MELGAFGFLQKPLINEILVERVSSILLRFKKADQVPACAPDCLWD